MQEEPLQKQNKDGCTVLQRSKEKLNIYALSKFKILVIHGHFTERTDCQAVIRYLKKKNLVDTVPAAVIREKEFINRFDGTQLCLIKYFYEL